MAKEKRKIPFKNNRMMSYVDSWNEKQEGFEWRDNYTFKTTMTIISYGRGRSSVTVQVKDLEENEYQMFISDFIEITQTKDISNGKFTGEFTFVKKGANYGLQLVKIG